MIDHTYNNEQYGVIIMSMGIYAIINKTNNKRYIGQTRDLEHRKKVHFTNLKKNKHINTHLQNAYNLYGESNFTFVVLQLCSEENLDYYEDYYIHQYDALNTGYNICEGGLNNCPDNTNEKHGMWRKDIPNELIKQMYLSGKQSSEISKIFGCSRRTIDRRLHKIFDDDFIKKTANQRRSKSLTGIKHPKGINHSNYDKSVPTGKKLYKEYLEGNTQEQLAEKYNTNQATISSRICEYKKTIPQPYIRRNITKNNMLWDNAIVGYRKADMFRRGRTPDPISCFHLKINGGNYTSISSMEWISFEIIADLMEEYISEDKKHMEEKSMKELQTAVDKLCGKDEYQVEDIHEVEDKQEYIQSLQEIIEEAYTKQGLTDEVLQLQVEVNKLRHEHDIHDPTEVINKDDDGEYVQ